MPAPITTLTAIRQKVRRITRSPSLASLSDDDLDQYINTFVVYDFPEQLRTFNLRKAFTFVCNPFQSEYRTDDQLPVVNQLFDFQNRYVSVHPPLYIAGYQGQLSQSREQFFGLYPIFNSIQTIGVMGDGATMTFTGTINSSQTIPGNLTQLIALLQGQVMFDSIGTNGEGLAMVDAPVIDAGTGFNTNNGNLYIPGNLPAIPPTVVLPNNTINYVTGVFTVTFPTAPADQAPINSQTSPQALSIPRSMLYHNNTITIRPVPDQPYRINFEVYANPTALLDADESPSLNEWWQYIAYGASKKIFEDRMDSESVQQIMPEFEQQRLLCNRRTIVQNANTRAATIYSQYDQDGSFNQQSWWGGWNGPF
jgi:hypothetical protein